MARVQNVAIVRFILPPALTPTRLHVGIVDGRSVTTSAQRHVKGHSSPSPVADHVELRHSRKVPLVPRHYGHFKGQSRRGDPEVVRIDQQTVIAEIPIQATVTPGNVGRTEEIGDASLSQPRMFQGNADA